MRDFKINKIIKRFFLSLILSTAFIFPAMAFEGAILKEITISSKDNYDYKIILKTDKDVPVEKYSTSDNRIVIDLQNTKASEHVNTVYNNTPEIDNVFVQNLPNDKIRIFIQGLNISSSKVILDSRNEPVASEPEAAKPVENPIVLPSKNHVVKEENNEEIIEDTATAGISLKQIFSKEGFDWLLRIFAVIFVVIGCIKLLNRPQKVTIDLSTENIKEREKDLYRTINERKELLTKSIGNNSPEKIRQNRTPYSSNMGYGLREYQNNQRPPQKTTRPALDSNAKLNNANKLNSALKTTRTPIRPETSRPALSNTRITKKDVTTAEVNVDNTKFLETMAAIYQKSGRDDLARNIRQNIIKSK